ncbi:MAG: hypothetical protein LLG01_17235, partial [Planctomycetaceae bacterium]|nr:hypothetical protein [Planctomycetaceae bacterium]
MATAALSAQFPTLVDVTKRLDPNGNIASVAELLAQTNEIIKDAVFIEGNLPTGHRVTIRTGLPTVYWRAINQGVPRSKSTTAQVDESCGMLEAYSAVDVDLARLNGNSAAWRLSEDTPFIEAMNQTQANTLFNGNPITDPRQYLGLAGRYSAISGAGNAQNVISGSGSSTVNTSIYLVVWGEQTVFCTYPKGSQAGLQATDQGQLTVYDSNSNPYQAYQSHYKWDNGLVVKDWRYCVRICNIDTTNLVAESSAADLIKLMVKAMYRIPNLAMGRPAFYANRTVSEMLAIQALNKSNGVLSVQEALSQFGRPTTELRFLGIPVRTCDKIL